ncbi:hypothetical protein KKI43_21435 [Arthrobacter sp. GN70]|nr:hypothetical protein [Arthrobacter sp. GN70]
MSTATVEIVKLQLAPVLVEGVGLPSCTGTDALAPVGRHQRGAHIRIAQGSVDLALWDLRAARHGVRLQTWHGDAPVRCYASALGFDVRHPLAPDVAQWIAAEGYAFQKWRMLGDPEEVGRDLKGVKRIVERLGDGQEVAVDGVGRWDPAYAARALRGLADLGVRWVEEPVADPRSIARFGVHVPLAYGEHVYDLADQIDLVTSGLISVWQPDVGWSGGLTPALLAAQVANIRGLLTYPHGGTLEAAHALAVMAGPSVVPAVEYHLTQEPTRQRFCLHPQQPVAGVLTQPPPSDIGSRFSVSDSDPVKLVGAS